MRKQVSLHALSKYLSLARGQVREIVIGDERQFGMDDRKLLALVTKCPTLERLEMGGYAHPRWSRDIFIGGTCGSLMLPRLKRLVLGAWSYPSCSFNLLQQVLLSCAGTLEELSISRLPDDRGTRDLFAAPMYRLQVLRLTNGGSILPLVSI